LRRAFTDPGQRGNLIIIAEAFAAGPGSFDNDKIRARSDPGKGAGGNSIRGPQTITASNAGDVGTVIVGILRIDRSASLQCGVDLRLGVDRPNTARAGVGAVTHIPEELYARRSISPAEISVFPVDATIDDADHHSRPVDAIIGSRRRGIDRRIGRVVGRLQRAVSKAPRQAGGTMGGGMAKTR